jgi:TetR/AcrR family transcriptional repressor of nem operon
MTEQLDTATRIVEVAQKLIQERGYNAFSYADIAQEIGIRKASIHYYFPNKTDLVKAVVSSYRKFFHLMATQVDQQIANPEQKLRQFALGFGHLMFDQGRICLCCMLATELKTLPDDVGTEVLSFFRDVEDGITKILKTGVEMQVLEVAEPIETEAKLLLVGIEGALLVASAFKDWSRYETVAQRLVDHIVKSK